VAKRRGERSGSRSKNHITKGAARQLFPRGIDQVHVSVDADGRTELKVAGPPILAAPAAAPPANDALQIGSMVPHKAERDVVGAATTIIRRGTPEFQALTKNNNADVVFKDEEGTGADRVMTAKLSANVNALAALVKSEWPETKLRITEAWDENMEHGTNSVHYEARAADLTTSPVDGSKLGRLGRLAVNAGFDWVFYENALHVHVSKAK
jgi:Hedgehog amino-terminal signalling domain